MNKPVFYTPDNWKYEYAWVTLDVTGIQIDGDFGILVGTYDSHSLYIRGTWGIVLDRAETFDIFIEPFPEYNEFIFDVETLEYNGKIVGNPEKAREIIDIMWRDNEKLCDSTWRDFNDYIKNHQKEVFQKLLKTYEETNSVEYKRFMKIYKPEE